MKDKVKQRKYIKQSFKYFSNVKKYLLLMLLFYVILSALGFISPILEANLITSITKVDIKSVIILALVFLVVTISEDFLWHFSSVFWRKKVRAPIMMNIRASLFDTIMRLQISNFDSYTTGFFQERIKTDPAIIARVVNAGQRYLLQCITNIGVLIYVIYINWVLGLIYITGVAIVAIIQQYTQEELKNQNRILRKADEKVNSLLSEDIRGIRDIKLLNLTKNIKKITMNVLNENNEIEIKRHNYESLTSRITRLVLVLTVFIVIIVGIKFVDMGLLTSANLIVLFLYNGKIFSLMSNYADLKNLIKEYELAVERIMDIDDNNKYLKEQYGNVHLDNVKGTIEFKDVSFGYNKNKVLNNLSFKIKSKDTVAIVGSSGSGKTTILNLITKSYLTGSGQITIDGVDINDLDEDTIRNNISIITQNPYIFNMSIMDNLKLVKPDATKKEIIDACKEASFYDFVMSLPKKFNTLIGEGGVNLSGGQRQRLAIARALLKESKILLFDEATSALDNITQKEIQESIDKISEDYTIIIIAHRLSTIKNCSKIYILNHGEIVDSGSHSALLKRNKDYKKLYSYESVQ